MKKSRFKWLPLALIGLLLGACQSSTLRPRAETISTADYQTSMKVYQRLNNDPITSRYDFHVVSENGVVTLSGFVPDAQVRSAAVHITRGSFGVQAVVDKMRY